MNSGIDEFDQLLSEIDELDIESEKLFVNLDKVKAETNRVQEISQNTRKYINDIDCAFAEKTGLTKSDMAFFGLATGLQVLRQYLLKPQERKDGKAAAEKAHDRNEKANNKFFDNEDPTNSKKYYYASKGDILDVANGVPYDIVSGSKKFGIGGNNKGLNGDTHRFRTLGHDPILGLYFGTANILTNTLTAFDLKSYHVKSILDATGRNMPNIYAQADTIKIYTKFEERFRNDKPAVGAALIKQIYHIQSDKNSIVGIPLPFISSLSPKIAEDLASYGIDFSNAERYGKQFMFATLIDVIVAMLHRLLYDGRSDMDLKVYKVRTKKILDYSGIIASASNVILGSVRVVTRNKKAMDSFDVGGIAYTGMKLVKDKKYITKIKKEFLDENFAKLIQGDYEL
ncbi:hypothetical protein [Clostridium algidicarnis]|uniref:Uncharacterized protein n=1 Tax=Clostridium algidicarnis TaxID=37659 RepID=A0ABS6C600_9CLOT|nr:hypothetical protein [Clostridium algidicarnis]MBU3220917.1 hypothetical protein [Clostridium algidicarnis]